MREYDKECIEYLYKRLDSIHKSFVRKVSIITIVIVNIYFGEIWDQFVKPILLFFGTPFPPLFVSFIILFILWFLSFELDDIYRLNKELQKYDPRYDVEVSNIEESPVYKLLIFFLKHASKP